MISGDREILLLRYGQNCRENDVKWGETYFENAGEEKLPMDMESSVCDGGRRRRNLLFWYFECRCAQ